MQSNAPDTPSTDMSLLERVGQQDNEAWERFVEIYAPVVLHWCKRQGLREADREDVFQEVSRALLSGLRTFRRETENQQFRRYLWTITHSKIQDVRRKAERALPLNAAALADFDRRLHDLDEEEQAMNPRSEIILLRQILKQVGERVNDPKSMQVFEQVVIEQRPTDEVAKQFGMTPNAVRRTKARLLSMLRQEFKEFLPPG